MIVSMRIAGLTAAALLATAALPALARDITVQMKDSGAEGAMVFEPAYVKAAPGDTIHFVPANASHNAQIIPTIAPDGVAPSGGQMGKPFDLKVTVPGLYGIKCLPHYSMGMVALIQVGPASPAAIAKAQAASLPSFAKKRMAGYLARVK